MFFFVSNSQTNAALGKKRDKNNPMCSKRRGRGGERKENVESSIGSLTLPAVLALRYQAVNIKAKQKAVALISCKKKRILTWSTRPL